MTSLLLLILPTSPGWTTELAILQPVARPSGHTPLPQGSGPRPTVAATEITWRPRDYAMLRLVSVRQMRQPNLGLTTPLSD
jgi:hypothetical protein